MPTFDVSIAAVNEKHQPLSDLVIEAYDADLDPSHPNAVLGRATTGKNGFATLEGLPDDKRIIYKPEVTRLGGGLMSLGGAGAIAAGTGVSVAVSIGGVVTITVTGAGVDHGLLTGLADDDHPQYATNAEFDDHSARHNENGADELFVEALGTAETDTTLAFKPDGSGGVTTGTVGSNLVVEEEADSLPTESDVEQITVPPGALTSLGAGAVHIDMRPDIQLYDASGLTDGTKTNFPTPDIFQEGSCRVYANGLILREGTGLDYTEDANRDAVTLTSAPASGDDLLIEYTSQEV